MTIEVIVGLPHLAQGPILARAKALQVPTLISANALSRWTARRGWREWQGFALEPLRNAEGLKSVDLDSAGFSAMRAYGGFPWSTDQYMALAAAFPFRRFASLDYCCEPEIAHDREEVLDRLSRTIRANRDCRERACDLGILERFMPVIQGRIAADYERCLDALSLSVVPGAVIGVGSMCRRDLPGSEGLVAIFEHLHRILPAGVRLHGFGVKGAALPYLAAFGNRVASIDSQAYGIAARQMALRQGTAKTDALVADCLEQWLHRQIARLREPSIRLARSAEPFRAPPPASDWEKAISMARQQIRDLIESGDLDHHEITDGWIEQWAADLYRERVAA